MRHWGLSEILYFYKKNMIRWWLILILLLQFFCMNITAQHFTEHTILVARLKEQYRQQSIAKDFENQVIEHFLRTATILSISRLFPQHQPPSTRTDEYGQQLVDLSLIFIIEISETANRQKIINSLLQTGLFEYVEPYPVPTRLQMTFMPDDPFVLNQYYLSTIEAYDAWNIWRGDTNYVIGIVDTGYDFTHPDLVDAVKYNMLDPIDGIDNDNDGFVDNYMGWNLGMNNNNPQYGSVGHGIHVSGIAGASANNGFGIAGVGYHSKLLPVRVDNQHGSLVMAYPGIVYAADHGAKVINCSWGSTGGFSQFSQDIINYATINRKALVVAAAGNSNNEVMFYPCAYNNVLCVAATKNTDEKWENSSFYYRVDISAPGHSIYSTWANGSFVYSSGTSMAAPIVSGAAALVWSYYPHLLPQQIKEHIKNTVDDIYNISTNSPYRDKLGYGRINMYKALSDTMKPGIQLQNLQMSDNNDQNFTFGDTLSIVGHFINYLEPTHNLVIRLVSLNQDAIVLDSIYLAGSIGTMQTFSNLSPFRIFIHPQTPDDYKITLKFEYEDGNYRGYNYVDFTVNKTYIDLDTNNIKTTVTSHGMFGYNDYSSLSQGIGFRYGNSANLSSCIGFFLGRSPQQVADRLYGFVVPYDQDLLAVTSASYIQPPILGHQHINGKFDDSGLSNPMGLEITFDAFAFNEQHLNDCIFLKYRIENKSSAVITDLHAGLFSDWDLKTYQQNKSFTLPNAKTGYVQALDNSLFAAIQLLSEQPFRHFAIDNNGADGSINLNDGFSELEKFMTLTNTRQTAGNAPNGNDVSSVVATGPFTLQPNEYVEIVFAVHVTTTFQELLHSLNNAQNKWSSIISAHISETSIHSHDVLLYPVPAEECLNVRVPWAASELKYDIIDVTGNHIASGILQDCINVQYLKAGIYFIKVSDQQSVQMFKFIKQ